MSFFWKRARALAQLACVVSVLVGLNQAANSQEVVAGGGNLSSAARATFSAQFKAFQNEKAALTPAQRKLATALAFAIPAKKARVTAAFKAFRGFAPEKGDGRSDVIITAKVTPALLKTISLFRGSVVSTLPGSNTVRALLSPSAAEQVAKLDEVKFIRLYAPPITHAGKVTSQGDISHVAAETRDTFKISGAGIKIGVLSDGVDSLARSQASGELPAKVTVINNGKGVSQKGDGDEGTAMLEIVHDLAPDAQLFYASAFAGKEEFADNIRRLRKAGCNIIVDDVVFLDEGVYQDDVIAQAVTDVVADGALYFSSAGNEGNQTSRNSGTWDGTFKAGGTLSTSRGVVKIQSWDGDDSNVVTQSLDATAVLQWADPLGASTNDYDLYALDSNGQIVSASQNIQADDGTPYESVLADTGDKIVVALVSGVARPIHLELFDGTLQHSTPGSCFGHAASTSAIAVAAVSSAGSPSQQVPFDRKRIVEDYSSDGFRTYYFDANGNKKNYTVKAPQIAAADGVSTSVPGYTAFYGTSAAAPHAAAIAALVWSYDKTQTNAQVRSALTDTAIDIMGSGYDRDSGYGIVRADLALNKVGPPVMSLATETINANEGTVGNKSLKITVKISKKSDTDLNFGYATKSGTARNDMDFVSKTGTATIPAGSTSADIFIEIIGDGVVEPDESFTVLFSKNTVPFKGSKTLTINIINDDAAPTTAGAKPPSGSNS